VYNKPNGCSATEALAPGPDHQQQTDYYNMAASDHKGPTQPIEHSFYYTYLEKPSVSPTLYIFIFRVILKTNTISIHINTVEFVMVSQECSLWEVREILYVTQFHSIFDSWTTMDIQFAARKSGRSEYKVSRSFPFEYSKTLRKYKKC
jgi:hypothetical protein